MEEKTTVLELLNVLIHDQEYGHKVYFCYSFFCFLLFFFFLSGIYQVQLVEVWKYN